MEGLLVALGADLAPHDGRRGRARHLTVQRRPSLHRPAVGRERHLRLHQAVVPADREVHPQHDRRRLRPRPEDRRARRLLHATVRRRDVAHQQHRPEPDGAEGDARERGREPGGGAREPDGGPAAEQGGARGEAAGGERPRARPGSRGDAREGHLPERPDAAHPVRARDRDGAQAPDPRRLPLDQQVLRRRPLTAEVLGAMGGEPGLHGLLHLVGEPGRATRRQGLRGLPGGGAARGARRHRAGDRRARGGGGRLLPRRNAAFVRSFVSGAQEGFRASPRRRSSRR